jgi:hypothetical protein
MTEIMEIAELLATSSKIQRALAGLAASCSTTRSQAASAHPASTIEAEHPRLAALPCACLVSFAKLR